VGQLVEEARQARRLPTPELARAIRRNADVSQERMANELGVHRVTVARWEAGQRRPRGQLLQAYAALLDALQREIRQR
jgi:DNA-binding transcriptional regulator YiaG